MYHILKRLLINDRSTMIDHFKHTLFLQIRHTILDYNTNLVADEVFILYQINAKNRKQCMP